MKVALWHPQHVTSTELKPC